MTTATADQLLTIPEVADRLRLGKSTVYELIAAGRLEVHNLSRGKTTRIRISESDLDSYIKSTKVQALQPQRRAA